MSKGDFIVLVFWVRAALNRLAFFYEKQRRFSVGVKEPQAGNCLCKKPQRTTDAAKQHKQESKHVDVQQRPLQVCLFVCSLLDASTVPGTVVQTNTPNIYLKIKA